jgi:hypothetical protein
MSVIINDVWSAYKVFMWLKVARPLMSFPSWVLVGCWFSSRLRVALVLVLYLLALVLHAFHAWRRMLSHHGLRTLIVTTNSLKRHRDGLQSQRLWGSARRLGHVDWVGIIAIWLKDNFRLFEIGWFYFWLLILVFINILFFFNIMLRSILAFLIRGVRTYIIVVNVLWKI